LTLVQSGQWSSKDGIAKLHRLLISSGQPNIPSHDTLSRLVDQMHSETGKTAFFRTKRKPRASS
jgi:hypothetical protein